MIKFEDVFKRLVTRLQGILDTSGDNRIVLDTGDITKDLSNLLKDFTGVVIQRDSMRKYLSAVQSAFGGSS